MELVKEEWWPTPIYYTDIDTINNNKIELEIRHHRQQDLGRQFSNRGGYQSNDVETANYPELHKLKQVVESCFKACFLEWKIDDNLLPNVSNMWININYKNNYNIYHTHPNSIFSAVYYVKCDEDHPPIIFESPLSQNFLLSSISDTSSLYSYPTVTYKVQTGRLLIFPSWLAHYVDNQETEKERISVAFNTAFFIKNS